MDRRRIILASASPRRLSLLAAVGITPEVHPVDVDETPMEGEAAQAYVSRLARAKCETAAEQLGDDSALVIGADTAVVVEDVLIGKPASRADFHRMIEGLSGRAHHVYTAVALRHRGATRDRVSITVVVMREISAAEAGRYWETGEPHDKAGGYAVQGLGAMFVSELHGSHSGVVGLPLFETASLLADAGADLLGAVTDRYAGDADG